MTFHPGDVDEGPVRSSSQAGLATLIPSGGAVTQPNPAPSDAATPSLVELDQDDAMARVLNAAMDWAEAWGDTPVDPGYMSAQEIALLNTARDYRKAVQS